MINDAVFEQLKQAMCDKDLLKKEVLQLVKAAIDLQAKEHGTPVLEQDEIVIKREVKQTEQALEGAEQAGRDDLIANEKRKLAILTACLPQQVTEVLTKAGVTTGMNMGDAMEKVMKTVKPLIS